MKELLKQFAAYNVWANQKLLECIAALTEEQHKAEIINSFNGLFNTVLHIWDAESMWWQRLKLQERVSRPSENFAGNFQELMNNVMSQSRQWEDWVNTASDLSLEHVFQYQNTKKEQFKQPVNQVLLHLFNHGSYHRGQLVTMLRQSGIDKIPQTDYIIWSRKK
jgi:uncharacterized damage-inducible protein DinB